MHLGMQRAITLAVKPIGVRPGVLFRHFDPGSLIELRVDLQQAASNSADPDNHLRVIYQPRNRGKGAAVRTGFEHAQGDVVLVQDADLEYSPEDYPQLVAPIINGDADVVFGSRYLGNTRRVFNFWHCLINQFLTTLSNLATGLNLTDMETCYKLFDAKMFFHSIKQGWGLMPLI